ncbi:fasciclin [Aphanothece hegewaldii CCALA 016]|uniref:Fasciclin n=1 Tax=Aphanothece hegewaldii CCALA 016 TaxID=2107694 RepID=A0A2T1M2R1_9CHRO|nr:fasciclin domain-containing protein [Aphanothece hegewaldii]PSF39022.1 fasciclin [Aphanothece hegewaldii CCALA 016]
MGDILETVANTANLTNLARTLQTTELVDMLKTPGPFTVFAPTDEAFAQLTERKLDFLLEDQEKLKRIIAYHLAFGDVRTEDLRQIDEVMTVEGSIIAVEIDDQQIKLNDANVITSEKVVDNGVIYLVDRVLTPALVISE